MWHMLHMTCASKCLATQYYCCRFQADPSHLVAIDGHAVSALQGNLEQQQWCAIATPDRRLFSQALSKHASLDFFDYNTYNANSCHPHLQQLGNNWL